MSLSLVLGISAAAFLIAYFSSLFDKEEHVLLRLLLALMFVAIVLLIPKATLDSQDTCDIVLQNTTIAGNTTSYEYAQFCVTNTKTTQTTFFKALVRLPWIFGAYLIVYFNWRFWLKDKVAPFFAAFWNKGKKKQ